MTKFIMGDQIRLKNGGENRMFEMMKREKKILMIKEESKSVKSVRREWDDRRDGRNTPVWIMRREDGH